MATESLLITCLADGSYHVKATEPAGEAGDMGDGPIDQSVQSPDEVMQLVQQFLDGESREEEGGESEYDQASEGAGDTEPTNPKAAKAAANKKAQAMWDQEAAKRGM